MSETLNLILTKFTDEAITITSLFLVVVMCLIVAYWLYNRKKLHKLSHQIPASVVKNYLDSIIQNSNALKSSLFRGGGLDITEGIPSVLPTADLTAGPVSLAGDNSEELNRKNAEINALRTQISEKDGMISDLQNKLANAGSGSDECPGHIEEIERLKAELAALRDQLAAAEANAGGGGGGDDAALAEITAERDELKERLMEYEIIEEDLANLKRLQQENEQLKASLAAGGGAPPPAAEPEEEPVAAAPEEPEEDFSEPEVAEVDEPEEAPAEIDLGGAGDEPDDFDAMLAGAGGGGGEDDLGGMMGGAGGTDNIETKSSGSQETEQKSAEELLSEFEKMLG
ncbi:MAG: hypothetical protein EP326_15465 [Deltaproteobacteria bacterium]|nr:MAG: hypothetical protein EP326_15465 [Deltaproteobacteria bacterium]TNF31534.1 MAG: hypothetical protein EP319_01940 [Deltaproteobacteria bacterium]